MAATLIGALGDEEAAAAESPQAMLAGKQVAPGLLDLVNRRMQLLRNAYLSAAGHLRPGIQPGLPLDAANEQAAELGRRIAAALGSAK